jgi:mannose-6-phosphate isomerase-like protein (cupin superfamily)
MQKWNKGELSGSRKAFRVLATTDRSQVATMTLNKGEKSGEYGTDHPQSDQFLYALSGSGVVKVEHQEFTLVLGELILIPAGLEHQVIGESDEPFISLSFYAPVAYPEEATR